MTKITIPSDAKFGNGCWTRTVDKLPDRGRNYLIVGDYAGAKVYDVAFFEGLKPDGSAWWILGASGVRSASVIAWSEIQEYSE